MAAYVFRGAVAVFVAYVVLLGEVADDLAVVLTQGWCAYLVPVDVGGGHGSPPMRSARARRPLMICSMVRLSDLRQKNASRSA